MGKIKQLLKKNQKVYNFLGKIKYALQTFLSKIFGTSFQEFLWKYRHIYAKDWAKNYTIIDPLHSENRKLLMDEISSCAPFKSVLEIGCASALNLYFLAKAFPASKLYGTDISKEAILTGREWLKKKNIQNIFLSEARAEDLGHFADKSIDVIFTRALLIYIAPDKINKVLKEIFRMANKAVILVEMDGKGFLKNGYWMHDYRFLLGKFVPGDRISLKKIPEEIWGGDWGKSGYIIKVNI